MDREKQHFLLFIYVSFLHHPVTVSKYNIFLKGIQLIFCTAAAALLWKVFPFHPVP